VSDNGVGFVLSEKVKGIGLKNIKSRVEFHEGKLKITTAPGAGCTLEVEVPVVT
jgi:two-component system sensor histidine kinase UhpB